MGLIFAGCLNEPPESDDGSNPTGIPPPPDGRQYIQFLNCTEVLLAFEVPDEWVADVVPSAFVPHGITSGTTAVRAIAQMCPRTVTNDSVIGPTSQFWTFAFAEPRNHSWREQGFISWYVLDYVTNSTQVASRLREWGLPADTGSISLSSTPLPTSGQILEWSVEAKNFSATFHYRTNSDQPQWTSGDYHLWFGTDHFRRVDLYKKTHVESAVTAGELSLQGSSRLGAVLKSNTLPWDGTTVDDDSDYWTMNNREF